MCCDDSRALSFETLLTDPLIQLVMRSDRVTTYDMVAVLQQAAEAAGTRTAFVKRLPAWQSAIAGHA